MVSIRCAKPADVQAIYAVLEEIVSEIPVRTDGADRQRLLSTRIERCCVAGHSLVAAEASGAIVGQASPLSAAALAARPSA